MFAYDHRGIFGRKRGASLRQCLAVNAAATTEKEWAERTARHFKAKTKRANVTYEAPAERLKAHGFEETKASIANKLARATVPAAFFMGTLAAFELKE